MTQCDLDHEALLREWAGKRLPVGGCECPSCGYRFEQPLPSFEKRTTEARLEQEDPVLENS